NKVTVIRRGVDRGIFHPGDRRTARLRLGIPAERTTLVSAGRLVPVKDHRTLIRACTALQEDFPDLACYVLGDGPLHKSLRSEIAVAGLRRRVHLIGAQPQHALGDWYRAADLVVLPSLSEGIPNVLLEA